MTQVSPDDIQLTVATPGNWTAIDVDELRDERAARRLLAGRISELPTLADHEDELAAMIARSAEISREYGVVFCSVLADIRDGTTPVTANLAIAVTATPPAPELPRERRDLGSSAQQPDPLHAVSNGLPATEEGVQKHAVDDVVLQAGPAVRIARIHDVALGEHGPSLAVLTVQYWLLAPGGDRMVVLSFSTPSLSAQRELAVTFHRIAMSVSFDGTEQISGHTVARPSDASPAR